MSRRSSFRTRRLSHESLECRRLLAATCDPPDSTVIAPLESSNQSFVALPVKSAVGSATDAIGGPDGVVAWLTAPFSNALDFGEGDLVLEHADRVFVVDQIAYNYEPATLYVFNRDADGTLTQTAAVDVGFVVARMIPVGDQVVLMGRNDWSFVPLTAARPNNDVIPPPLSRETQVLTVSFGEEVAVIRQQITGSLHSVDVSNGQLIVTGSNQGDAVIMIYPPPPIENFVKTFDVGSDGITEVASLTIPGFGISRVEGNNYYSAGTTYSGFDYFAPPTSDSTASDASLANDNALTFDGPNEPLPLPVANFTRYLLGNDAITEVATTELGTGYVSNVIIAENGLSAIVLRSEYLGAGPTMSIDLLNLAGDAVTVVHRTQLENFQGEVVAVGSQHVVLRNYLDNSLVVVDTNQSTALEAVDRVRRVPVPDRVELQSGSLQVNDDMLVLRAVRRRDSDAAGDPNVRPDGTLPNEPAVRQPILLTVSIEQAAIIADTDISAFTGPNASLQLFSIDTEASRFGFVATDYQLNDTLDFQRPRLTFGRLSDSGEFSSDGVLPAGRWIETDANADRLLARTSDQLLEFDWVSEDEPVALPLGELEPPILAVNDSYELNDTGNDHLIDVLGNDMLGRDGNRYPTRIVELIGAPEGVRVLDDRLIRVPAQAIRDVESLRFGYVISDGETTSTAVVEISVRSISEQRVRELVQAVRERAATDLDVPLDQVDVVSVERVFYGRDVLVGPNGDSVIAAMSSELNADGTRVDRPTTLAPGVLVSLAVPGATARYHASLEGEIAQLFVSRPETLAELGLRAVNDDGQRLERLVVGQEFWLEFSARDLRPGGRGVYAAFFDLIVPNDNLVITGPVVHSTGFSGAQTGSFTEGEIDDLGAVDNGAEAPGQETQALLRIGVRAVGAGRVTLQPEPADSIGTATLIHGLNREIPARNVRYLPLSLSISADPVSSPLDIDNNGSVTAGDALEIIRFLNLYGSIEVDDLESTVRSVRGESEDEGMLASEIATMRRLDASGDRKITALDALIIINDLQRQEVEAAAAIATDFLDHNDDDEESNGIR